MNYLISIPQCSSTNDEILFHLSKIEKEEDVLTLYTFDQTKGRGQYGNVWQSYPNQNLAFSMAFHVKRIAISDNLFNFHTANILRRFIAKKTENTVEVKWPNDIIILGKKISGMLIEKRMSEKNEFFIVGIGINILQKDFQQLPKAGSIFTQTNIKFDLEEWAKDMEQFFTKHLFEYASKEEILQEYNANLFRKEKISVFEIHGVRQNGIIKYADEEGFLWIDLEHQGIRKFYHKELELLY